ncbi:MAG: CRISPR-associated CARF protein Csa3 [Desulfurococcaceae archaeon]
MNKTVLATFGWTEASVISSILRHGLSNGDKILLIMPERRDERSEAALRDLKAFITTHLKNIGISELRITIDNPATSIYELKRAIEAERDRKCIINLSGGMRAVVVFTYIAALLAEHPNIVVELETEDRKTVIEVPKMRLADFIEVKKLPQLAKEIMKKLLRGPLDVATLRKDLNAPTSTLYYAQMKLLERGYIMREKKGKTFILKLTPFGELLARLMEG